MGSRGGGGSNGGGSQGIPAASRRMVQSLKEIVDGVTEAEIYSTLKDCNMDPNEAVNRLLSQDTFHEVKSKREKKKEFKDTTEFRPRGGGGGGGTSNRGARTATDRYGGRSGSNQFSSSESGGLHGKPTYKRENGTSSFTSSTTPASKVALRNTNWNPPTFSDSHGHENEASVSQPSSGYQSAWSSTPGQKSMADVVKMGRPQNKSSTYIYSNPSPPQTATHSLAPPPPPSSDDHGSSPDNEWPSIEQPQPVNLHSITDTQTESVINSGQTNSNSQFESNNQYLGHETNEAEVQDESSSEDQEEDYEDDAHEGNLDISVEEDNADIENVNVHEENHVIPPQEDAPSVVIPDHLQVNTANCSHLSFGSFGANMNQGYSGHFTSTADTEPEPEPVTSSVEQSQTTNLEYYEDGSTRTLDRTGVNAENYDLPSSSSQTALKQDNQEVTHGNQYGFPPATHTFDSSQLLNPSFPQSQTPSQAQIPTPFLNAMSANGHPVRESDLSSYSQFSVSQPMPTRYASSASPINDPTISMAEALKNVVLTSSSSSSSSSSSAQPAQQQNVPQHLTVQHPYSQHTLPLGPPFSNMISYPYMAQNYAYMPSTYHQQLAAAILPQYKNSLSSNLPQSATLPSGYTSFGNSTAVPANYEELLNAHYKDNNSQLLSLQQNEWVHGGGSRTMAAVPASAYYSLQSQNHHHHHPQPPSGFRQGQQPTQGYGGAGLNYPDFFKSQAGVLQEHQLQGQNPRDGGAQGQQKQLWQNGY